MSKFKGKKILLIIVVIIVIIIATFGMRKLLFKIDLENRYKEFEKVQTLETKGTLSYVEDKSFAVVNEKDYVFQDDIGAKIDSIKITDNTLTFDVSFKFNKEFTTDYKMLSFGYAIYDENKNVYAITSRMHIGEIEKYDYNSIFLQKELGVYNSKDMSKIILSDSTSIGERTTNETDKIVVKNVSITAKDKFPMSKKIYIKIIDIGYFTAEKLDNGEMKAQNYNLSNSKWLFEYDLPEEMNNRVAINLKLDNEIPGIKIINAKLTETNLVINFESEDYMNLIQDGKDMPSGEFSKKCIETLNITDGEGKVYQELSGGTTDNNGFKITFDTTKKDLNKKLFINYKIGDNQYKSELLEK